MKEERKEYILLLIIFALCLTSYSAKAQTKHEVKQELIKQGVKHYNIVLKQSILETGHYGSYSCKHRKNLFGFRYKGAYLEFDTWQESVAYYARWQKRKYKGGDYFKFLKSIGYAEDPNYINKIKSIKI